MDEIDEEVKKLFEFSSYHDTAKVLQLDKIICFICQRMLKTFEIFFVLIVSGKNYIWNNYRFTDTSTYPT